MPEQAELSLSRPERLPLVEAVPLKNVRGMGEVQSSPSVGEPPPVPPPPAPPPLPGVHENMTVLQTCPSATQLVQVKPPKPQELLLALLGGATQLEPWQQPF
ncbi:MAG: hypothetical protein GQE15_06925 [Archangiaceae bacterium]|nr:hypothetical protein [Archangiaceae bacterium]